MGYIATTMGRPKAITAQQEKFCQLLVFGNNGEPCSKTEAARMAGYADPVHYGSRLMNPDEYPLVVAYEQSLRQELKDKYFVDHDGHVAELGKMRDMAKKKGQLATGVRAEELRGKLMGFYVDQKFIVSKKVSSEEAKNKINRYENIVKARKVAKEAIDSK